MKHPVKAGGNIYPARFVKRDTSNDQTVLQCTANAQSCGITVDATAAAPTPGASGYAAVDGGQVRLYTPGEATYLELAGTVAAGDKLKSDSNGCGVVVGAYDKDTPQYVGAIAAQAGVSGDKIKVDPTDIIF